MEVLTLILLSYIFCTSFAAQEYQKAALKEQNDLRNKHNTANLDMDEKLNKQAVQCAEKYTNGLEYHDCVGYDMGENIGICESSFESCASGRIKSWYKENVSYDYGKGISRDGNVTGHVTQLLWKGSKKFGFGCFVKGMETICVGLYTPPGNYPGEYTKNVFAPKK